MSISNGISFALISFLLILNTIYSQDKKEHKYYFTKYKSIQVENDILIGSIKSLDVYDNDLFLITDAISKQVILFDAKKNTTRILIPEKCIPGFKLIPAYAKFNNDGLVYVINEIGTGYIFNKTGVCKQKLNNFFNVPHICFDKSNNIVSYVNTGDNNYLQISDYLGNIKSKFGQFPKAYQNAIKRIMGGGLVVDENDNVYQVNVISPTVYVYKNSILVKKIEKYNSNFRLIEHDLKNPSNPNNIINYFKNLSTNHTIVDNLFLADRNLLLVQFYHDKKYSVQLVSTDGNNYLTKPIILDEPFILAKNGYAYTIMQPEPINDLLPNPIIVVYKINFNY